MQLADTPLAPGTVQVIGPSLMLELSWAAHSVWSPGLRAQHRVLAALADDHPDLSHSLREFWNDGTDCFPDLQVLAHLAGALEETDFERLVVALGDARAHVPDHLMLRSETDDDRAAIMRRLGVLRDDDQRWNEYIELFRSLFSSLEDWWNVSAVPAVERAVDSARRELDGGADWNRMVTSGCVLMHEQLPGIIERREPVVLALCALYGKGMYLDLPGCQLIGLGAGLGELGARTRTEALARRIRVLADPTRLAILDHLRTGGRSVGDIALDFDLAQPTVSAHIKQLRQAGLVTAVRRGSRLELTVNSTALQGLAGELSTLVST